MRVKLNKDRHNCILEYRRQMKEVRGQMSRLRSLSIRFRRGFSPRPRSRPRMRIEHSPHELPLFRPAAGLKPDT
jgi:hypothetical protein